MKEVAVAARWKCKMNYRALSKAGATVLSQRSIKAGLRCFLELLQCEAWPALRNSKMYILVPSSTRYCKWYKKNRKISNSSKRVLSYRRPAIFVSTYCWSVLISVIWFLSLSIHFEKRNSFLGVGSKCMPARSMMSLLDRWRSELTIRFSCSWTLVFRHERII